MPLKLMYITNNPKVAQIAENADVDRIFIDLETLGKEERQRGRDTVKSHHHFSDIDKVKEQLTKSQLIVRVNPLHDKSKIEINEAINRGADLIMLPMFRTAKDVETFTAIVGGRAKTLLLLETIEAEERVNEICAVPGIDEIHIGLNDLHIAHKQSFMFELLADGTVEKLTNIIKKHHIPFGFGGIAQIGEGILPAEKILIEHYRLGSSMAILSRSFCNSDDASKKWQEIQETFQKGVKSIRTIESNILNFSKEEFVKNGVEVKTLVGQICKK